MDFFYFSTEKIINIALKILIWIIAYHSRRGKHRISAIATVISLEKRTTLRRLARFSKMN
jgi:hypothetical protein